MGIVPMILHNSETWINIPKQTMEQLNKLQTSFYQVIFSVGWGYPTPILYFDTAGLKMTNQILKRKLLFLHHVATLPEDSLAREILEVQAKNNLPGLVEECREVLAEFGVTDLEVYSKSQWKKLVREKINEKNKNELLEEVKKYKKLSYEQLSKEEYERKPYLHMLTLINSQLRMKLRGMMTPTVRMNFKNDPLFAQEMWSCPDCRVPGSASGTPDTETHIMVACPANEALRGNRDLTNDRELAEFFRAVIERRQSRKDL